MTDKTDDLTHLERIARRAVQGGWIGHQTVLDLIERVRSAEGKCAELADALAPFGQYYKSLNSGWHLSPIKSKSDEETFMGAMPGPETPHKEPYAAIKWGDPRRAAALHTEGGES